MVFQDQGSLERGQTHSVVVDIYLTREQWEAYYRGHVRMVQALALDGRDVRFPAKILHGMLLSDGIRGRFRIQFDAYGKFVAIERVVRG